MNAVVASRTLVNGQRACSVDIDNRGLAYGDGLFETVLVRAGEPLWLAEHLQRLASGARRLQIPCDIDLLAFECSRLLLGVGPENVILKIVVTRGAVARGYSPLAAKSVRIVSLSPAG
ncbi:aminotransferase class IV, partial [Zhongshania sp.]